MNFQEGKEGFLLVSKHVEPVTQIGHVRPGNGKVEFIKRRNQDATARFELNSAQVGQVENARLVDLYKLLISH